MFFYAFQLFLLFGSLLSLSLLVRWLKSSCCGLHRLSPLFPVLCHLGCLMQSTIQPFLNIRVPGSLRSSSATSAFHLSLDDDFLQPIVSNGMAEKTQFSLNYLQEQHSLCFQILEYPLVCSLVLPRHSQKTSVGPHFKGINLICNFFGDGP